LVGSNNITLSQSTAANGAYTLTISGPSRPRINIYAPQGFNFAGSASAAVTHGSFSNGTLFIAPFHNLNDVFPGDMTIDRLGLLWSNSHTNTTSTTGAHTSTFAFGFYTLVNATQLSRLYSGSVTWTKGASSAISSQYHGVRWITVASNSWDTQPILTNTQYWLAWFGRTSGDAIATGSNGPVVARHGFTQANSGIMGAASASGASRANFYPFKGYVSASTSGLPDSLALSGIIHTGSAWAQMMPHIVALGSAATGIMGAW
jgi:hypothetical protein